MTTTQQARTALVTWFTTQADADTDMAQAIVDSLTDEQVAQTLAKATEKVNERAALRARLTEDKVLGQVVCPPATWKSAADRADVAARAVAILDATAAKHGHSTTALATEMLRQRGTVAQHIATWTKSHDYDPRTDGYGTPGNGFDAFGWAVRHALEAMNAERDAEAATEARARRDAAGPGAVRSVRRRGQQRGVEAHWGDLLRVRRPGQHGGSVAPASCRAGTAPTR